MKEKTCQLDEFYWLVLGSLITQRLVLLIRRKKGKVMLPLCLLFAVWPHTPTTQAALSTTRLLKTKRSIILHDFWFDDFFLLVTESQQSVFNFSQMQVAKSSPIPSVSDVIDFCWILYIKPSIVATFFFQRTTAIKLFYSIFSWDFLF